MERHVGAWMHIEHILGLYVFSHANRSGPTNEDDWGEAVFAANVVFEPLLGELFRSNLVQQAAAGNGDFVTPTIVGAGEYDYARRDLRMTITMFEPRARDKEFAEHNKEIMQGWLSKELGQ